MNASGNTTDVLIDTSDGAAPSISGEDAVSAPEDAAPSLTGTVSSEVEASFKRAVLKFVKIFLPISLIVWVSRAEASFILLDPLIQAAIRQQFCDEDRNRRCRIGLLFRITTMTACVLFSLVIGVVLDIMIFHQQCNNRQSYTLPFLFLSLIFKDPGWRCDWRFYAFVAAFEGIFFFGTAISWVEARSNIRYLIRFCGLPEKAPKFGAMPAHASRTAQNQGLVPDMRQARLTHTNTNQPMPYALKMADDVERLPLVDIRPPRHEQDNDGENPAGAPPAEAEPTAPISGVVRLVTSQYASELFRYMSGLRIVVNVSVIAISVVTATMSFMLPCWR